jgi:hypothetical protein
VGRITRTPGTKEVFDFVDKWSLLSGMFYKRNKVYTPSDAVVVENEKCLF